MTKAEYEAKYEQCNNWHGNISVCKEYIASLEADNARLEKALGIAGAHIVEHENMCPWNVVDGYVSDECSGCIATDKPIKSECWKAAFIKEAK